VLWLSVISKRRLRRRNDPRFQRGLCVDCGYDLSGLGVKPRCPECGRLYSTPPTVQVRGPRLRPRVIAAALTIWPLSLGLLVAHHWWMCLAYFLGPVLMYRGSRAAWTLATADADDSAVPFFVMCVVAFAPTLAVKPKARRIVERFVKRFAITAVIAFVLGFLHACMIWAW
jgi:hypothetical protein